MSKIKVAHVISSLKIGGAETVLYNILAHLNTDKYEHTVVFFHDGAFRKNIEQLGIKTVQIKKGLFSYDPIFLWNFFSTILKLTPDFIHASLWAANLLTRATARILKIKFICVIHTVPEHEGKIRNIIDNFTFFLAPKIVTVSHSIEKAIHKQYFGLKNKTLTITNGIDDKKLIVLSKKTGFIKKDFHYEQNFVIGNVGRFIEAKNQDLLLHAFAEIVKEFPHTRLIIIGHGPKKQELKNKAELLGIQQYVNFIIDQPAYRYYTIMDCFVLPSLYEGLPMALLEALAFSIPSIATSHDVIENNKSGLVIKPSLQDLISALRIIIQMEKAQRDRMGFYGNQVLQENFSIESMINLYGQLFENKNFQL